VNAVDHQAYHDRTETSRHREDRDGDNLLLQWDWHCYFPGHQQTWTAGDKAVPWDEEGNLVVDVPCKLTVVVVDMDKTTSDLHHFPVPQHFRIELETRGPSRKERATIESRELAE